ncbi:MAG: hypothetical protein Q8M92_02225, partial [Candidatus Subteraquimicrobiales bacterium]|nr:hypothetical protein [Candidatus Subteraquimicrobiales bacterium]
MKRIKSMERQGEHQKINNLAKAWNPVCDIKENVVPAADILTILDLLQKNRGEAKAKLEKYILDYPLDPIVLHSLSLLYYWELQAGKGTDKWEDFISYWVTLMHHDNFWTMWKGEREQYYFENRIEWDELTDMQQFIWATIEAKVPDSHKGYLLLEKRTAETIHRLNRWGYKHGLTPLKVICGPIMSKTLRIEDRFKTMVKSGIENFPFNDDFNNLMLYLSPLGLATIFIEEKNVDGVCRAFDEIRVKEIPESFRKRYIDLVIESVEQQPSSEKIRILKQTIQRVEDTILKSILFNEYEKVANEFAGAGNWEQASTYLMLALEIEPQNKETENNLFQCYLNVASRKLEANKTEEAVSVIEKAERLQLDEDKRGFLAQLYWGCAIAFLDSNAPERAKEGLADVCLGCAIKLLDIDKLTKAESMALRAEKYAPQKEEIKQLLENVKLLRIFGKKLLNLLGEARKDVSNKYWGHAKEKYLKTLRSAEIRLGVGYFSIFKVFFIFRSLNERDTEVGL